MAELCRLAPDEFRPLGPEIRALLDLGRGKK